MEVAEEEPHQQLSSNIKNVELFVEEAFEGACGLEKSATVNVAFAYNRDSHSGGIS
jgi:hypothetical protein